MTRPKYLILSRLMGHRQKHEILLKTSKASFFQSGLPQNGLLRYEEAGTPDGRERNQRCQPSSIRYNKKDRTCRGETVTSTRNWSISPVELLKSLLIYALETILSYSLSPSSTVTASLQTEAFRGRICLEAQVYPDFDNELDFEVDSV